MSILKQRSFSFVLPAWKFNNPYYHISQHSDYHREISKALFRKNSLAIMLHFHSNKNFFDEVYFIKMIVFIPQNLLNFSQSQPIGQLIFSFLVTLTKNQKISLHFQAKCEFFVQKINEQDSWIFRSWSLWPKNEKRKMEWTGHMTQKWNISLLYYTFCFYYQPLYPLETRKKYKLQNIMTLIGYLLFMYISNIYQYPLNGTYGNLSIMNYL